MTTVAPEQAFTAIHRAAGSTPLARLVIFHHAGGSGAAFARLARELPDEIQIVLHDLPGRGRRHAESPGVDMRALVTQAADAVDTLGAAVPVGLFGHSMGAILASEVSSELHRRGRPPAWLGLSGRVPPRHLPTEYTRRPRLHTLDDDGLLTEIRALGGLPDAVLDISGFLSTFLPVVRADFTAVAGYVPRRGRLALQTPVGVFGGRFDPWAPPDLVRDWREHTRAEFTEHFFDGGHFYFEEIGWDRMANSIAESFDGAILSTRRSRSERHMQKPVFDGVGYEKESVK